MSKGSLISFLGEKTGRKEDGKKNEYFIHPFTFLLVHSFVHSFIDMGCDAMQWGGGKKIQVGVFWALL